MIRVQFQKFGEADPVPTWLDGSVRAVPAEPFADVDSGQGGITLADIVDGSMIASLSTFSVDAGVYVESEDVTDFFDNAAATTESSTHIWWRAIIVAG